MGYERDAVTQVRTSHHLDMASFRMTELLSTDYVRLAGWKNFTHISISSSHRKEWNMKPSLRNTPMSGLWMEHLLQNLINILYRGWITSLKLYYTAVHTVPGYLASPLSRFQASITES